MEVHSVFPKFPPEAVDALRAASDEASITAVGRKKIGKPKGYLAAFNLFVQAVRASLVRERDMKKLTNNEVNKVLGARWAQLADADKAPYEERARRDKIRYMNEIREYNANAYEHVVPRLKSGVEAAAQSYCQSTAYAQFTNHDRNFIAQGLSGPLALNPLTCSFPKYLSSRWQSAMPEERELYESMSLLVSRTVRGPAGSTESALSGAPVARTAAALGEDEERPQPEKRIKLKHD